MQAKVGVEMMPNPESAFLGPKLWDKPISLQQFNEDDFFVMNIDDFLAENEIDKDKLGNALKVRKERIFFSDEDPDPNPDPVGSGFLAGSGSVFLDPDPDPT